MSKLIIDHSELAVGDEVRLLDIFGACEFEGVIDHFGLHGYITFVNTKHGIISWTTAHVDKALP